MRALSRIGSAMRTTFSSDAARSVGEDLNVASPPALRGSRLGRRWLVLIADAKESCLIRLPHPGSRRLGVT